MSSEQIFAVWLTVWLAISSGFAFTAKAFDVSIAGSFSWALLWPLVVLLMLLGLAVALPVCITALFVWMVVAIFAIVDGRPIPDMPHKQND